MSFIAIQKPAHLAHVLGLKNETELLKLCGECERFYYTFEKIEPNKIRILSPSKGKLKIVQSIIKKKILQPISLPTCVLGGTKGKSNIDNAAIHKGKKEKFCTDLKKFFPSINQRMIYRMFVENGFSPDVSRILTRLNTFQGNLPTGLPTSTHIANLVFVPIDLALLKLCEKNHITYTRWVDDLTFSAQQSFTNEQPEIINIITSHFRISHRKTSAKKGPATITGIITKNNGLDIKAEQKERLEDITLPEDSRRGLENYRDRVKKA